MSVISGLEEALPDPGGTQVSMEESQAELTSGLDVGECEKRAREMFGVGRVANVAARGPQCPVVGVPLCPGPPQGLLGFPHL